MRILLIVSGSIAVSKLPELIRLLLDDGHSITSVFTKSAQKLMQPIMVAALTGSRVYIDEDMFLDAMVHIRLVRECDVVLVLPASADFIAKAACGMADELASTLLLSTNVPVIFVPAMNPVMWMAKPVQNNISLLRDIGINIIEPEYGVSACGEVGVGRMACVKSVVTVLKEIMISSRSDL